MNSNWENYKGETITECGNGYTVFFCGDEVYFDTKEEAKRFIDEEILAG